MDFGADPTGKKGPIATLQTAIDSGARTVFLPGGANFQMAGNVDIREPVKSITRLAGRFFTEGTASWNVVNGAHPKKLPDTLASINERDFNRKPVSLWFR